MRVEYRLDVCSAPEVLWDILADVKALDSLRRNMRKLYTGDGQNIPVTSG